jgi:excisionase family DNA binding protein
MPPTYLDARELAERLGVSYGTLLTWRRRGRVPSIRDGRGRYLFNLSSVFDALARQSHQSNGHPEEGVRTSRQGDSIPRPEASPVG